MSAQAGGLGFNAVQIFADMADFCMLACGHDLGQGLPAHHQRARKHGPQIIPPRAGQGIICGQTFPHGDGFPRQQGFIGEQMVAFPHQSIGGDTVPLRQNQDIPAHNIGPRNALTVATADDQGAGTAEGPQAGQHIFAADFLNNGNTHGQRGEEREHQGLDPIPQHHINAS